MSISPRQFAVVNVVLSAAIIAFLVWLVYFHRSESGAAGDSELPAWNALFNGMSATLLWGARSAIRRGHRGLHQRLIYGALTCSALFLASYIYYHFSHGDTRFPGTGTIRTVYLGILASHIIMSIAVLPMILAALFFAFTRHFKQHRRIAGWTWLGWMYVSVTGVLTYFMLHVWYA